MTDVAQIVAGLESQQREAIYKALVLLDGIAGSGIGHEGDSGETLWSDDVWLGLYDAFFPTGTGDDESLAALVRTALLSKEGESADA